MAKKDEYPPGDWRHGLDFTESRKLADRLRLSPEEFEALERRKASASVRRPVVTMERHGKTLFLAVSPGVAYGNIRKLQDALSKEGLHSQFNGRAVTIDCRPAPSMEGVEARVHAALASGFLLRA